MDELFNSVGCIGVGEEGFCPIATCSQSFEGSEEAETVAYI
jgi:hypothetical protein